MLRSLLFALPLFFTTSTLLAQTVLERSHFVTKVYPVAEFVVPVDDFDCLTASGGVTTVTQSRKMQDQKLVRLIQSTVAPKTWVGAGGSGTIQYHPQSLSMSVTATPDVHRELEQCLAAIQKLQDDQVVVEVHLVSLSREACESLAACEFCTPERRKDCAAIWFQHNCLPVSESEVTSLLTTLQKDTSTSVMTSPKCTVLDGQRATIKIGSEDSFVGWKMQPRISSDRRHTAMAMTLNLDGCTHETVLCVPAGGYCLIGGRYAKLCEYDSCPTLSRIPYLNRLFKNVGYGELNWLAVVKVTPFKSGSCEISTKCNMLPTCEVIKAAMQETGSREEPASAVQPKPTSKQRELLDAYFDACAKGDLRLIKKYHRELQQSTLEKELKLAPSEWRRDGKRWTEEESSVNGPRPTESSTKPMLQWEQRWLPARTEEYERIGIDFEIEFSIGNRDEHAAWTSRWVK